MMGCAMSAERTVEVGAYVMPGCAMLEPSQRLPLRLVALGDFEPDNSTVALVDADARAAPLELPPETQQVSIDSLGDVALWGIGNRRGESELPVSLWNRGSPCTLSGQDSSLVDSAGSSLGASAELSEALLAGVETNSGASILWADLATGETRWLYPEEQTETVRFASVVGVGRSLSVVGGISVETGRSLDSVTGLVRGQWATSARRTLQTARSQAASLTLPGGDALIVGGRGQAGEALASVEIVPATAEAQAPPAPALQLARIAPSAISLDGDSILVAGGYTRGPAGDGPREPVGQVELLRLDPTFVPSPPEALSPAALDRAFVGLAPSGALAVGGCIPGEQPLGSCVACNGDTPGCLSEHVWWIDPTGRSHRLPDLEPELLSSNPRLLPAEGGRAWLIAGSRSARFDPWLGRFEWVPDSPFATDRGGVRHLVAVDSGLALWLASGEAGATVLGLRHGRRSRYAQDVSPLLATGPERLLPLRLTRSEGDLLRYAPGEGLELRGPSAAFVIAETDYAALTLSLSLAEGPAPFVRLSPTEPPAAALTVGGEACPWPAFADDPGDGTSTRELVISRSRGRVVVLGTQGDAAQICSLAPDPRVRVEIVGTAGGISRLSSLEIHRAEP